MVMPTTQCRVFLPCGRDGVWGGSLCRESGPRSLYSWPKHMRHPRYHVVTCLPFYPTSGSSIGACLMARQTPAWLHTRYSHRCQALCIVESPHAIYFPACTLRPRFAVTSLHHGRCRQLSAAEPSLSRRDPRAVCS